MDTSDFIGFAQKLRRSSRDQAMIEFLDHALSLAQKNHKKIFDRNAYQKQYMREYRAKKRVPKKPISET